MACISPLSMRRADLVFRYEKSVRVGIAPPLFGWIADYSASLNFGRSWIAFGKMFYPVEHVIVKRHQVSELRAAFHDLNISRSD